VDMSSVSFAIVQGLFHLLSIVIEKNTTLTDLDCSRFIDEDDPRPLFRAVALSKSLRKVRLGCMPTSYAQRVDASVMLRGNKQLRHLSLGGAIGANSLKCQASSLVALELPEAALSWEALTSLLQSHPQLAVLSVPPPRASTTAAEGEQGLQSFCEAIESSHLKGLRIADMMAKTMSASTVCTVLHAVSRSTSLVSLFLQPCPMLCSKLCGAVANLFASNPTLRELKLDITTGVSMQPCDRITVSDADLLSKSLAENKGLRSIVLPAILGSPTIALSLARAMRLNGRIIEFHIPLIDDSEGRGTDAYRCVVMENRLRNGGRAVESWEMFARAPFSDKQNASQITKRHSFLKKCSSSNYIMLEEGESRETQKNSSSNNANDVIVASSSTVTHHDDNNPLPLEELLSERKDFAESINRMDAHCWWISSAELRTIEGSPRTLLDTVLAGAYAAPIVIPLLQATEWSQAA